MHTRRFPRGAVASPHHLASAAGRAVLVDGGNAVDAAVAANLVLAVVTPYYCGTGGDLLAIVWDGRAHGVVSVGAAPAGATPDAIRAAIDAGHGSEASLPGTAGMPTHGALPVTVPGAVAGWTHLLQRWGGRSFGEVAQAALRLAEDGFPLSDDAVASATRSRARLGTQPGWSENYGPMADGGWFRQPPLAAALRRIADDGPDAVYRGPIGERIAEVLQANGSTMTTDDLAAHRVEEVDPLSGRFRDVEVLELPPPTQGVTALTALGILDRLPDRGSDEALDLHREIEASRLALADRQDHLGDPASMRVTPAQLLDGARVDAMAAAIDDEVAARVPLGRPAPGGTAYLCAADDDGLLVSLIQSNFVGFGSGVVVSGWGIGLHDRGAHFKLDVRDDDPDVIAPGRRPMHTLIPGLTLRDGSPELVFGTMGGDGQAQLHAQLLRRWVDAGQDLQAGLDAPRFVVDLADGAVVLEDRVDAEVVAGLRQRGHEIRLVGPYEHSHGHAHVLRVEPRGYAGASDPRAEGAVIGW